MNQAHQRRHARKALQGSRSSGSKRLDDFLGLLREQQGIGLTVTGMGKISNEMADAIYLLINEADIFRDDTAKYIRERRDITSLRERLAQQEKDHKTVLWGLYKRIEDYRLKAHGRWEKLRDANTHLANLSAGLKCLVRSVEHMPIYALDSVEDEQAKEIVASLSLGRRAMLSYRKHKRGSSDDQDTTGRDAGRDSSPKRGADDL